jgi:hypothetical protein
MKKNKNLFLRLLYRFHRYAGLAVALLAILLSITGIALNHTDYFQFDEHYVSNTLILDWYGIKTPDNLIAYSTANHWLSQIENQLFFNSQSITTTSDTLLGAVENDQFIVAALSNSLLMLNTEGEIIEQIPYSDVGQIGVDGKGAVYLQQGQQFFKSDDGLLSWKTIHQPNINSSSQAILPEKLSDTVKRHFSSGILPQERVLLDIHSGRFFGNAGVLIIDLSGILIILLAISGSTMWLRHLFKRRRHRSATK